MIEVLPLSSGNVIGVKINGKLLHADYEQFVPQLESLIQQYGSLRFYCEISNYQGISLRAIWDETKFDVTHCRQIERCAVVGNSSWQKWMTNMTKVLFYKADVRYFNEDQADEAWNWVNENAPCCCCGSSKTGNACK
ncbi:MAG: STAS/SEC14 domain-containing protein [Pirellulales bacterium]|nr:STAS/SEC14 domain-containing protein [Pirellulales bacterium]